MKVVGLITEYNPFHNGHKFHMEEAKRVTNADHVIVVMSGNFVQRGTPAIINKYSRAKMALICGADLVFELPVCFSTGSAEYFALGAVSLLNQLGIVDEICFGSEYSDIHELISIARILSEESLEYKSFLCNFMKKGITFPLARTQALKMLIPEMKEEMLSSPNSILGIEYLKALIKLKSKIKPISITRKNAGYHDETLADSVFNAISSATAIRKSITTTNSLDTIKHHVPSEVFNILEKEYNRTFPITENDYTLLLQYKLMEESKESLVRYLDINQDIANRIKNTNISSFHFSELAQEIKSKQWTLTRVNRALLHVLLRITSANMELYKKEGYTQYARILGVRKDSTFLLRQMKEVSQIPLINKVGNAKKDLSQTALTMLEEDLFASHLYNQVVFHKYNSVLEDEYTHGVVMV